MQPCRRRPQEASSHKRGLVPVRGDTEVRTQRIVSMSRCRDFREKSRIPVRSGPVPKTDTGRWIENIKAREITIVKELGKMTP